MRLWRRKTNQVTRQDLDNLTRRITDLERQPYHREDRLYDLGREVAEIHMAYNSHVHTWHIGPQQGQTDTPDYRSQVK